MIREHQSIPIADIAELPHTVRQLNNSINTTFEAVNRGEQSLDATVLEQLATFSADNDRLILGALSKHFWSIRMTDYEHLGRDIMANLAENSGWAEHPSVLIAPNGQEIRNHTSQRSDRFRNVAMGTTIRMYDTNNVTDLRLRNVADLKAFVPYDMTDLRGNPIQPSQDEVIERDKQEDWYEQGVWTGSRDVLAVALSSASSAIASYCKGFGSNYIVAAAHGDYWVFMPTEMDRRHPATNIQRLGAHLTTASSVVIYDPGKDEYKDTTQLGIPDDWFPDGQMQYDVDISGVEVTKVERARNRIRFSAAGSYEFGFGRVDPADCDWTGPAEQVITLETS